MNIAVNIPAEYIRRPCRDSLRKLGVSVGIEPTWTLPS